VTGESIYNGNRSRKSFRHERRLESFLRKAGQNGLDCFEISLSPAECRALLPT
jgi:hypothetical protein